ncbi:hypothetical protein MTO96_050157 [Rhipicephalus appendiculatus]
MLSDAEETLTDTDKAGASGSSTDPNSASLPVTEHKNDPQLGEGMDEDSNASAIVTDTAEEDAYNGACWKGGPHQATRPQRRCPRSSVAPHS